MTTDKNYSAVIGVVNPSHIYSGKYYPPLYEYLILTLYDIKKEDLATDEEYCTEFLDVFNTKELWSSEGYLHINNQIIDELPMLEYPQTVKALNNYGIIANCYNYVHQIAELTEKVDYFNQCANDQEYIDIRNSVEIIQEASSQAIADNQVFRLVSNCSQTTGFEKEFLNTIYSLQAKYGQGDTVYYLSLINNVFIEHRVFSIEFLLGYLHPFMAQVLTLLKQLNYEIYQYYNCLYKMEEGELCYNLNDLFDDIILELADILIDQVRSSYVILKQAYIKMGVEGDEIDLINAIINQIDIFAFIINSGRLTDYIYTNDKIPLPYNQEAVDSVLESIPVALTNMSETQIQGLIDTLENAYDEDDLDAIDDLGEAVTQVINSVSSGMAEGVDTAANMLSDALSDITETVEDALDTVESLIDAVDNISDTIATAISNACSSSKASSWLDKLSNLTITIDLFSGWLGKLLCALKNLLCAIGKILSLIGEISNIAGLLLNKASAALEQAQKIEAGLKSIASTDLGMGSASSMKDLASKMGDKASSLSSTIANLTGSTDIANTIANAYKSASSSIMSGLNNPSTFTSMFDQFSSGLLTNTLNDVLSGLKGTGKCSANLKLNLKLPQFKLFKLNFKLPKFVFKPLNCKK